MFRFFRTSQNMAAGAAESDGVLEQDILDFVKESIENSLNQHLHLGNTAGCALIKRNKSLKCGDFSVILPGGWPKQSALCLCSDTPHSHDDRHSDSDSHNSGSTCQCTATEHCHCQSTQRRSSCHGRSLCAKLQNWNHTAIKPIAVQSWDLQKDAAVFLKLQRAEITRRLVTEVQQSGHSYGRHSSSCGAPHILVNTVLTSTGDGDGEAVPATMYHLRALLLAEHIMALLRSNGYSVSTVPLDTPGKLCLADQFDLRFGNSETHADETGISQSIRLRLEASKYRERRKTGADESDRTLTDNLNLAAFLADQELPVGGEGYDRNLQKAHYTDQHISQIAQLDCACQSIDTGKQKTMSLHITPYEYEFSQQLVDLGWRLASQSAVSGQQKHVVYGAVQTVHLRASKHCSAEDLFSLRRKQMRTASVMKYGDDVVKGSGWDETVTALTRAAIKFELLSTACRKPVKVDLSDTDRPGHTTDSKGGVFVMYNCARLANVLGDFDKAVVQGGYPPLPKLDDIDFTLLREEEEWCLLFNYILTYPSMLRDSLKGLNSNKPKISLQTHKVCQFLQDLSRDLSSYYSRVRILLEPRPHLLPLMYARLYLLRTVQQVLHNALDLLGIPPVTQV